VARPVLAFRRFFCGIKALGRSADEPSDIIEPWRIEPKLKTRSNAEQREALKQTFLRLLDDPQIQQKIVSLLNRRLG
jgi:hypothetical protein